MFTRLFTLCILCYGDSYSVRNSFHEEFHGWYAFTMPDGQKLEVVAVLEQGLGSIGTGSPVDRVLEVRTDTTTINAAWTRYHELVLLIHSRQKPNRFYTTGLEMPWVILKAEQSRRFPK
ncbi:MAG: hypothetical protein QM811_03145 [Pirellulales bacterium]